MNQRNEKVKGVLSTAYPGGPVAIATWDGRHIQIHDDEDTAAIELGDRIRGSVRLDPRLGPLLVDLERDTD